MVTGSKTKLVLILKPGLPGARFKNKKSVAFFSPALFEGCGDSSSTLTRHFSIHQHRLHFASTKSRVENVSMTLYRDLLLHLL